MMNDWKIKLKKISFAQVGLYNKNIKILTLDTACHWLEPDDDRRCRYYHHRYYRRGNKPRRRQASYSRLPTLAAHYYCRLSADRQPMHRRRPTMFVPAVLVERSPRTPLQQADCWCALPACSAMPWSGNSAVFAAPSRRRSLFHVSVTEKEMRPPIGPPPDGGGLLLVLSEDRCLLLVLSVNGCLLLVLSDHRCLLLVRSNDRCLLLVLFDERCLLLVRFNDRCLLLVLSDGRCLLLVLSDNKCLLLVLFDDRCLLLVHTGTRTAPEARRKVCKS